MVERYAYVGPKYLQLTASRLDSSIQACGVFPTCSETEMNRFVLAVLIWFAVIGLVFFDGHMNLMRRRASIAAFTPAGIVLSEGQSAVSSMMDE